MTKVETLYINYTTKFIVISKPKTLNVIKVVTVNYKIKND